MFGSKFETFGILGGLLAIVAIIASLFIDPAATVVIYTVLAWVNIAVVIMTCDPLGTQGNK
ncbi:MAG: hypothetical protein WCJ64_20130 [Rhodospirillaceae bacterium]